MGTLGPQNSNVMLAVLGGAITTRESVAVRSASPSVAPVTVTLYVPGVALDVAVSLSAADPSGGAGSRVAVTPAGTPASARETLCEKKSLRETSTVAEPAPPWATVTVG